MKRTNLWITIGIPGSGKSTWLNKYAKGPVVSRDAIRFGLLKEGDDYFKYENEVVKTFYETIQEYIYDKNIVNVYADATHLNEKSRRKLLKELDLTDVQVNYLYFDTPLNVCKKRNALRTGLANVPETVIENMYVSLQKTTQKEIDLYKVLTYQINHKGVIESASDLACK